RGGSGGRAEGCGTSRCSAAAAPGDPPPPGTAGHPGTGHRSIVLPTKQSSPVAIIGRRPIASPRSGYRADCERRQKAEASETPGPSAVRDRRTVPADPRAGHGGGPCGPGPAPGMVAVAGVPEQAWLAGPFNLLAISLRSILNERGEFFTNGSGGV